jgi:hypothetical protein
MKPWWSHCSVKSNSAGNEIGNFVCIRFMVNETSFTWTAVPMRFSAWVGELPENTSNKALKLVNCLRPFFRLTPSRLFYVTSTSVLIKASVYGPCVVVFARVYHLRKREMFTAISLLINCLMHQAHTMTRQQLKTRCHILYNLKHKENTNLSNLLFGFY